MTDAPLSDLEARAAELQRHPPGQRTRLDRVLQIARHYRWPQMARRAASLVRRRLGGSKCVGRIPAPDRVALRMDEPVVRAARQIIDAHRDHPCHRRGDLSRGRLVLLNREVDLGWPVDWQRDLSDLPHLWRFQLQYHEYLLSWLADPETEDSLPDAAWQTVWQFLRHWIGQHDPLQVKIGDDAWHPYCISRRVAVWVWLLAVGEPSESDRQLVLSSLCQQAAWLERNLERDLGGNHLLENLTALVLVSSCLETESSAARLERTRASLERELARQVLDHGEHFELSPMYHCQILGNLLKMAITTRQVHQDLHQTCLAVAERLFEFLNRIVHPDGEIPLLGDSGFGEAPSVSLLTGLAAGCGIQPVGRRRNVTAAGPYWIFDSRDQAGGDFLLFDRGEVAARALPAHGHCDLLNLVASVGGKRWIVDSGNYDYQDSSMRQYCRSSLAHNVVTVDGASQCDIWSRFRMGRRGRITGRDHGSGPEFVHATASHDGFRDRGLPRLTRLVAIHGPTRHWICADAGFGGASGRMLGYLHFSGDLEITRVREQTGNQQTFLLDDGDCQRKIVFFGTAETRRQTGWQCSGFGYRETSVVLVYGPDLAFADGPRPAGWVMYPADNQAPVVELSRHRLVVHCHHPATPFEWNFD